MKFWHFISVLTIILLIVFGYLGFKYYSLTNSDSVNSIASEKLLPTPDNSIDPFSTNDIFEYIGNISCVYPNNPEDCVMALKLDSGDEYLFTFKDAGFAESLNINDRVRVQGFINYDSNKAGFKNLVVKSYIKI